MRSCQPSAGCIDGSVWSCHRSQRTNRVYLDLDLGTHDLVPAVDAPDQPPGSIPASGATERMCEAGGGREVFLDGCALSSGGRLGEEVDYFGDFGFCGLGRRVSWCGPVEGIDGERSLRGSSILALVQAGDVCRCWRLAEGYSL